MSSMTEGQEGVVAQTKAGLGDAAGAVQEKTEELKEQGRSKLGDTLDQRTTQAGGQSRQVAQVLRQSGSQLRAEAGASSAQVAGVAEAAAERVERFGEYLERVRGDELLRDAEQFARRRPWMVAGIGLLAGLAASRFLKASSERRYGSDVRFNPGSVPPTSSWPGNGGTAFEPATGGGSAAGMSG